MNYVRCSYLNITVNDIRGCYPNICLDVRGFYPNIPMKLCSKVSSEHFPCVGSLNLCVVLIYVMISSYMIVLNDFHPSLYLLVFISSFIVMVIKDGDRVVERRGERLWA